MEKLKVKRDPRMDGRFEDYPEDIKPKLNVLRDLILEVAENNESISEIEETLKWGEPSYLTKKGSTIRINWLKKSPDQYAIYFKCTSKLVPTFKELFGTTFTYENNRAILFALDASIPKKELKTCIELALTYHTVKNLVRLGQ